jgi:hypothetical protein
MSKVFIKFWTFGFFQESRKNKIDQLKKQYPFSHSIIFLAFFRKKSKKKKIISQPLPVDPDSLFKF